MREHKFVEYQGMDQVFATPVHVTRKYWGLAEVLKLAGLPADVEITHTDDDGTHSLHVNEVDLSHETRTNAAGVPLVKVNKTRQVTRVEHYDEYEPVVSGSNVGQPSESLSCGSIASP